MSAGEVVTTGRSEELAVQGRGARSSSGSGLPGRFLRSELRIVFGRLGPALMGRLMDFAADGPSLAAASFHSAFNVANAIGASLGGAVLAAGLGYDAPAAAGAVLPLVGLAVFAVSVGLERRSA